MRNKDEIDFKKLYRKEFLPFAKKALIPTKTAGELIKFRPNEIQLAHIGEWDLRCITLKPRQVGFSTLKLLEVLFFASKVTNLQIGVVYQDERSARDQAEILQKRIELIGPTLGLELDTDVKSVRRFNLKPTNATIYTGSGAANSPLRGKTLQYLLCSELAFWKHGDDALDALLPAVDERCMVQVESTPNGMSNRFYEMYMESRESTRISPAQFKHCFYPWSMHSEYTADPIDGWEPCYEDIEYMNRFHLTLPQIFWRRTRGLGGAANPSMSKKLEFARNYPISDETCWNETMLDCPFSMTCLQDMYITAPLCQDEEVRIYAYPHISESFIMGIDTARGGADDNAFVIVNSSREVVACYNNNTMSPNEFGRFAAKWARKYNVHIFIESNSYGHLVAEAIKQADIPSRRVYEFLTDEKSKQDLMLKIDTWVVNHAAINDEILCKTLMMFSRDKAKMKHVKDDIGMAFGIALWGSDLYTRVPISFERVDYGRYIQA